MTDSPKRINVLISKALSRSPQARATHDEYFSKKKTFRYAEMNVAPVLGQVHDYARIEVGENHKRFVINTYHSDDEVAGSIFHEMGHIQTLGKAKDLGLENGSFSSLETKMAKTLLWELYSFNSEIEWPLVGFFNDLAKGDIQNMDFYKSYLMQPDVIHHAQIYVEALFDKKLDSSQLNLVDFAGYEYMTSHQYLDENEKKQSFYRARKAFATEFLSLNNCDNSDCLEMYINQTINEYKNKDAIEGDIIQNNSILESMQFNFYYLDELKKKRLSLENITNTMNKDDEVFLPLDDWKTVLKVETNKEFVKNIMDRSQHKNEYYSVSQQEVQNRSKGYKPKFY